MEKLERNVPERRLARAKTQSWERVSGMFQEMAGSLYVPRVDENKLHEAEGLCRNHMIKGKPLKSFQLGRAQPEMQKIMLMLYGDRLKEDT